MLPLLYVSRLDLAGDSRASFAEWFSRRHAPDLINAGFLSVSSFRALRGTPWVCNLYELGGLDAFGPAYQQARASDEESAQQQQNSTNQSLAVFEQVVTNGVTDTDGEGLQWRSAVLAPVVTTFRFSVDAVDDDVHDWYRTTGAAQMAAAPGCLSVRLGRQVDAERPIVDPRRWSVFAEWANQASALGWADAETEVVEGHEAALGQVIDPSLHVLRRHGVLHHPDLWQI